MTKAEAVVIKTALADIELLNRRLDRNSNLPPDATEEQKTESAQRSRDQQSRYQIMRMLQGMAEETLKESPVQRLRIEED